LINLLEFTEKDFPRLIAEIPDPRFLLQWAGPKYTYPLDARQLGETMEKTAGEKPAFRVFKAVLADRLETAGHIQLMKINYETRSCALGRVLIFQKFRGNGIGEKMVKACVRIAFDELNLKEIRLGVFDFNVAAIGLYKKIGFSKFRVDDGVRGFQNERWNLIRMKLYNH
jgi:RimJ/RimL family protein N-acetyltransferase